jgi:hypothetical protein
VFLWYYCFLYFDTTAFLIKKEFDIEKKVMIFFLFKKNTRNKKTPEKQEESFFGRGPVGEVGQCGGFCEGNTNNGRESNKEGFRVYGLGFKGLGFGVNPKTIAWF